MESSMPTENSMVTESTLPLSVESTETASTVLENQYVSPVTNNESVVAESPAAKERSPKQKEADEGAAEILKRMRGLYNTEFADIPANKRPKPPAWAARAALYKNGQEREDYIQNMMRNTRNSLMTKNSADHNDGLGSNSDVLMSQLMTALDTATRVAKQLKNSTRKGKRSSAMNVAANYSMNSGMNMDENASMNSGENASMNSDMNLNNNVPRTSFTKSKRVSPLMRKTKRASKRNSLYNEPPMTF
jgi:hypothetical protein